MSSLGSICLALALALVLGPLLGRIATEWFSGRGLSNLLVELRSAFLPFIIAPLLVSVTGWRSWIVIGAVVGLMQGISIARWIARRTGEWGPAMVGGVALGRSKASLISARATARGAVVGTLASTIVNVVLLEALLSALEFPGLDVSNTVGAALREGSTSAPMLFILGGTFVVLVSESFSSWLLQRRSRR